jgi:protoporphyrinogen oxidase
MLERRVTRRPDRRASGVGGGIVSRADRPEPRGSPTSCSTVASASWARLRAHESSPDPALSLKTNRDAIRTYGSPADGGAEVVVIGAGPAGLTAAYELTKLNARPIVVEKGSLVGGLARTERYKGYHFDLGGHRFFTKSEEVQKLWHEILGDDFLKRPRLSRIYYNGSFFFYPLKPLNALLGLGPWQSLLVVLSYVRWQLFPCRREDTFEQWVTNRFGRRLFLTFFKTYTEKVWGISCSELKAEWAAQRIKDLSLKTALLSMFVKPKRKIKSLIEEFEYPRLGPGMMWDAMRDEVERRHGIVRLDSEVTRIEWKDARIENVLVSSRGKEEVLAGTHFISSMPVTEFIKKLHPPAPPEVTGAADKLTYRDFLTVVLIINKPHVFQDNWIYVHDPTVKVGRIQNFKNWSPEMVKDPGRTSLGLEYFCTEGDALWSLADDELIELGRREVSRIGLAQYGDVEDGCVVRVPKAYPVYDSGYRTQLAVVRRFVDRLQNVQTIGRNGLHRYNNQDHAMLTGMLAVRNVMLGQHHDLWSVNTEQEYQEAIGVETEVDSHDLDQLVHKVLTRVFHKLDRVALGVSVGVAAGALLFLTTLAFLVSGSQEAFPGLLAQYFPGYSVSATGSLLGLLYGFATGFVTGWSFAFLRNAALFFYLAMIYRRAEFQLLRRLVDYF